MPAVIEAKPDAAQCQKDTPAERLLADLDVISYVISHDIQSPVRNIASGVEELSRLLANNDAAQPSLNLLETESGRLKILLQGLLDYIRLDIFVPPLTSLDMNEIVASALAALEKEIQESGASVTCETLPVITGHRGRLTRLIVHLVENALKFGKAPQKIHIQAHPSGDHWIFSVEDNGIGIGEEHHDIVFALFQRLHTAEAYPGHGIGLALARKIAEAHGGRMWVESAGQGSRFCFTLPMQKPS